MVMPPPSSAWARFACSRMSSRDVTPVSSPSASTRAIRPVGEATDSFSADSRESESPSGRTGRSASSAERQWRGLRASSRTRVQVPESGAGPCGTAARVLRESSFSPRSAPRNSATKSSAGRASSSSGAAHCTRCPPVRKTAMRSPRRTASSMSWVTKTMVLFSSFCRRSSSSWSWVRTTGSTAPNGSSISRTGGSAASARATPTRCCWPPESWCGYRLPRRRRRGRRSPAARPPGRVPSFGSSRAAGARWRCCRAPCDAGRGRPAG